MDNELSSELDFLTEIYDRLVVMIDLCEAEVLQEHGFGSQISDRLSRTRQFVSSAKQFVENQSRQYHNNTDAKVQTEQERGDNLASAVWAFLKERHDCEDGCRNPKSCDCSRALGRIIEGRIRYANGDWKVLM